MNTMLIDSFTADKITHFMPSDGALGKLSVFFDALSDVTRLKILSVLSVSALCVTDISLLAGLNQTTVSHQLKALKTANIVECKRQGKIMFYSLRGNGFSQIMDIAVGSVFDGE